MYATKLIYNNNYMYMYKICIYITNLAPVFCFFGQPSPQVPEQFVYPNYMYMYNTCIPVYKIAIATKMSQKYQVFRWRKFENGIVVLWCRVLDPSSPSS